MGKRSWLALLAIVAISGVLIWRSGGGDAEQPPTVEPAPVSRATTSFGAARPRTEPPPELELKPPPAAVGPSRYREAVAGKLTNPGEVAFRAHADAFFDLNPEAAAEHARSAGLTMEEARELTYFGLLAAQTMEWEQVNEVVTTPVPAAQQELAARSMYAHSEEMKRVVQRLNTSGATPGERAAAIAAVEADYLREYLELTGMTPERLDLLKARGAGVDEL